MAGLFLGPDPTGPMQAADEVTAVAGRGLRGDRYLHDPADGHDPAREITVFAAEGVRAARDVSGLDIRDTDLRRNVMTTGLDVDGLVGRRFRVGEVVVEGLEDNPPCSHLQRLADKPLLEPLIGHGGLRGRIVRGGRIRVGDPVVPLGDTGA